MYPAAQHNAGLVITVALVFGFVTLATMLVAVTLTSIGVGKLQLPAASRRYMHAIAGASVAMCGGIISFTGI